MIRLSLRIKYSLFMKNRLMVRIGRAERRFAEITSLPDDAFDELPEDKLKTLDTLLSQVQTIV